MATRVNPTLTTPPLHQSPDEAPSESREDLKALEKDYEEVGTESTGGDAGEDAAEGDEY